MFTRILFKILLMHSLLDNNTLFFGESQVRVLEWNTDRKKNVLEVTHGLNQEGIRNNEAGILRKDRLSSRLIDFKRNHLGARNI